MTALRPSESPALWWAPGIGVIEQIGIDEDRAVYALWTATGQEPWPWTVLPPEARELILAPTMQEIEKQHEQHAELVRLRAIAGAASAYILADECTPEYAGGAYARLRALLDTEQWERDMLARLQQKYGKGGAS